MLSINSSRGASEQLFFEIKKNRVKINFDITYTLHSLTKSKSFEPIKYNLFSSYVLDTLLSHTIMYSFTNNNNLSNKIGTRKTKKLPRNKLMMLLVEYQPEATDVLCGRGNMYSLHPGNQCFQRIICDHMKAYSDAEHRSDKIKIVDHVLCEVRNSGARIVKIDSKTKRWYELNDVKSHQKCGHCLRDTIRSNGKENKSNSSSNSNSKSRIKSASIAIKKQKRQARQHKQLVDFFSAGTGGKNLQHRLSLLAHDCSSDFLLDEENYLVLSTTTTTADSNGSSSFLLFDNEFPEDDLHFSPTTFFSQTCIK